MSSKLIYGIGLAVCLGLYTQGGGGTIHHGPGVLAPNDPIQSSVSSNAPKWKVDDFVVTPLADFEIEARVLLQDHFIMGDEARLSPYDLTLGWGPMSDSEILSQIELSRGHRRYIWRASTLPIPQSQINNHAANMHLIPANDEVKQAIGYARIGDVVWFAGQLVRVDRADGWHWKSSLTRTDSGNGACELVWVEEFEIVTPTPE